LDTLAFREFGVVFKAGPLEILDALAVLACDFLGQRIAIEQGRVSIVVIKRQEVPTDVVSRFAEILECRGLGANRG
jgi:hypothetical protein